MKKKKNYFIFSRFFHQKKLIERYNTIICDDKLFRSFVSPWLRIRIPNPDPEDPCVRIRNAGPPPPLPTEPLALYPRLVFLHEKTHTSPFPYLGKANFVFFSFALIAKSLWYCASMQLPFWLNALGAKIRKSAHICKKM